MSFLKRCSSSPTWGPAWRVSQVIAIFSMSFTSSPRKRFSRKLQRWGSEWAEPEHTDPKGPASGSSPARTTQCLWHPGITPLILGWLQNVLEKGIALGRFCIFQRYWVSSFYSLANSQKKSTPSRARSSWSNRHQERGWCWRPADAYWPGGWWQPPPRWSNSGKSGSSWLISNKELSLKDGVGWSRRQRMAEKVVLKVETGKEVGEWLMAKRRHVPGSVLSKHFWSKRQAWGTIKHIAYTRILYKAIL